MLLLVPATRINTPLPPYLYDYNGDTPVDLGTLPVSDTEFGLTSSAYDVNDANQVVGTSWLVTANTSLVDPAKYHAFIWEDGQK